MNLKKLVTFILLTLTLFTTPFVYADYDKPLLILDTDNTPDLPKNFRTTSDTLPSTINTTGLNVLQIAGGAEFSAQGLQAILQKLAVTQLTVIDLRQESHGFINGIAVSWYGPANAANAGKSPKKIVKKEMHLLTKLAKLAQATYYIVVSKSSTEKITEADPVTVDVQQVQSEEALTQQDTITYQRLYVQDYHAPDNHEVDRFIKIINQLPANQWIYFHCHAGKGRTTTFMAMLDMMRNAKTVSFDDIIARQAALGGDDFSQLPDPGDFKYPFAVERLNFLKQFYVYAQTNQDGFATSWAKWLKSV